MPDREKVLKGLERCKLYNKLNCDKCPYDYNGRGNGRSECTAELATDALDLLKEQEAVEPILEQDSMVCGACGHEVIWQKMLGDGVWLDEQLDYCPKCGKKVKWE